MKTVGHIAAAIVLVFAVPFVGAAASPALAQIAAQGEAVDAPGAAERSYLFVLTAADARMEDGRLSLSEVADDVGYFTERPYRERGKVPLASLLEHWASGEDSFAGDPPNAVLILHDQERNPVIVELVNPVREGDALAFDTRRLGDSSSAGLLRSEGPATLIIDGCIGLSCW